VRFIREVALIEADRGGRMKPLKLMIVTLVASVVGCNDLGKPIVPVSAPVLQPPTVTSGPFAYTLIVPTSSLPVNDTLRAIVRVSNLAATAETLVVGPSAFSWSLNTATGRTVMWGPKVVPLILWQVVINPFQTEDIYSIRQAIADESGVAVMPGSYVLEAEVRGVSRMNMMLTLK